MAGDNERKQADRAQLRELIDLDDMKRCLSQSGSAVRLQAYLRLCEFVFPRVSPVSGEPKKNEKSEQEKAIEELFK